MKGEGDGAGPGEFRQVPFPHLLGEQGQRVAKELGKPAADAQPLEQARRDEGEFHPPRMREDALDQDAPQQGLPGRTPMVALDMVARGFEQLTVVDAAGTRRFASATTQTVIYMPDSRLDEGETALLKGAHEINPAPGGIVLIARLQVSRARAKAESAMDAGERLSLVEEAREVRGS